MRNLRINLDPRDYVGIWEAMTSAVDHDRALDKAHGTHWKLEEGNGDV